MEHVGYHYYKYNYFFLSLIGLWPYDNSLFDKALRFFCSFALTSGIVFQLTVFYDAPVDLDIYLDLTSNILFVIICLLKYDTFYFNRDKVKKIIDFMERDWSKLQDEEELRLNDKSVNKGKNVTMVFGYCCGTCSVISMASHLTPIVLDIINPLNESRPLPLPIDFEYFIDHDKCKIFTLLHLYAVMIVSSIALLATETTMLLFVEHGCGKYDIACFRIKAAFNQSKSSSFTKAKNDAFYKEVVDGIKIQQKCEEYVKLLCSTFRTSYSILIFIGVGLTTGNMYRFTQALSVKNNSKYILMMGFCVVCQYSYMFMASYIGQELIDHGSALYIETFDMMWYAAPVPVKKLLLLLMQKSIRNESFKVAGIFVPSFECFAKISSASLSYFMVLNSLRMN